jgi:hypothetical protein
MATPAFPAPSGYTSNLEAPAVYLHTANIVGMSTCCSIGVVFYALRAYAKHVRRTPWIAEDCEYTPGQGLFSLAWLGLETDAGLRRDVLGISDPVRPL